MACRTVILFISLLALIPPAQAKPARVLSLNLCSDQLLMALADPLQILSLSPLARDPNLSFFYAKGLSFPVNAGRGETVLVSNADLVLAGPFESHVRRHMLTEQGHEVLTLYPWTSFENGRQQINRLGSRLGQEARANDIIALLNRALSDSHNIASQPRTILFLHHNGYVSGENSIWNEFIQHMGFVPYQAKYHIKQGGHVSLEWLIQHPPDIVILSDNERTIQDQGSSFLNHQALIKAVPEERRFYLPQQMTICEGPSTQQALALILNAIKKINH